MKAITIAFLVVVATLAQAEVAKITESDFDMKPDGSYKSSFKSDDGIAMESIGEVKEVADEKNELHKVVVMRGEYSYMNKDGEPESVKYYADETGFHAQGNSIPKA